jgi:DNA invertase Pin-like site-specific DNA recombinase
LVDSGVEVLFSDMPQFSGAMGRFMLISMANVAELEAGLISERTRAALAAAKARGKRLGVKGAEVLAPKWHAEANARAQQLAPVLWGMQELGLSMRAVAVELTKRKVPTARGGAWHVQTVKRLYARLASATP